MSIHIGKTQEFSRGQAVWPDESLSGHAGYPSVCYFIFQSLSQLRDRTGIKGKGRKGHFSRT